MIPRKPLSIGSSTSAGGGKAGSGGSRPSNPRTPPGAASAAAAALSLTNLSFRPATATAESRATGVASPLQLRWRKRVVNTFAVDELRDRLAKLAMFKPIPHSLPYTTVSVSPMYVTLETSVTSPSPTEDSSFPNPESDATWQALPRAMTEADARPVLKSLLMFLYALHRRRCSSATLQPKSMLWNATSNQLVVLLHCLPPGFFVKGTAESENIRACAAPEVLSGQAYGPPADIWSFGVAAVHLLTASQFSYETEDLIDTAVVSPCINHLSPSAVTLICQCLKSDASSRPTIVDLIMHPFFREGVNLFSEREEKKFMNVVADRRNWRSMKEEDGDSESDEEEEDDDDDDGDDEEEEDETSDDEADDSSSGNDSD